MSARKVLKKVAYKSFHIPALLYLRQALAVPELAKALSHLPRVNSSAIRIATDPQLLPFATPRLLEELGADPREDEFPKAAMTFQDCNCVASYAQRVAFRQNIYIYRVLEPERCTLSLVRRGEGWVLSELKGVCNQPPSPKTRRAVQQWIAASGENTVETSLSDTEAAAALYVTEDIPF